MTSLADHLPTFLVWLGRNSLQAAVLVGVILIVQWLLRDRLAPRWRYGLWMILLVRLVMPWGPSTSFSLYNVLAYVPAGQEAGEAGDSGDSMAVRPTGDMAAARSPLPVAGALGENQPPEGGATNSAAMAPGIQDTHDTSSARTRADASGFNSNDNKDRAEACTPSAVPMAREVLPLVLGLGWLAGALVVGFTILWQSLRLSGLSRHRLVTDQYVLDLLEDCKQQMGVSNYLAVVETEQVAGPALFGSIRPRLLLPSGLTHSLGSERLRHVFLHELAHLKRRDVLVSWVVALLQVLHWFNPLVWYGFARMRAERELACDALALSQQASPEPKEYGRTIVQLLESHITPRYQPSLAGVLEDKSQLTRRITMIARFRKSSQVWSVPAVALLVLVGAVALTNAQTSQPAAAAAPSTAELVAAARQVVTDMAKGNFARVTERFDATMKAALPAKQLQAAWDGVVQQAGPFQEITAVRTEQFGPHKIIYVTGRFQQGPVDTKVVFDATGKIAGLFVVPTPIPANGASSQATAISFTDGDLKTANDSLLNDGQRLYLAWTEGHFGDVQSSEQYRTLSAAAVAEVEAGWLATLSNPNIRAKRQAICNLAAIKSRKAVPALLKIAAERVEKDNADRWSAVRALGMIGDASVVPALIPLTYHYNQNTRFWAQISLVRLTGANYGTDWQAWANWWNAQGKQPQVSMTPVNWPCSRPEWMDPAKQKETDAQWIESHKQGGKPTSAERGANAAENPNRQALRTKYELRTRQDLQKYSREQLGQAERLYQVANKNWRSPEAKQSLQQMIDKYPDINRTGCAVLYMAQMSQGQERETLLKQAVDKHGDCFYGDGVQVGAYARFYLAEHYDASGQKDKAKVLYDEIRKDFPDAVNHKGMSLVQLIDASHPQTTGTKRVASQPSAAGTVEPEGARTLTAEGQKLFDSKHYDKAVATFQQVVDEYPRGSGAANALMMIGLCHDHLGQYDEAIAVLERAIRDYPDQDLAATYFYLGTAYERVDRTDDALAAYRQAAQRAERIGRGNTFPGKAAREHIEAIKTGN